MFKKKHRPDNHPSNPDSWSYSSGASGTSRRIRSGYRRRHGVGVKARENRALWLSHACCRIKLGFNDLHYEMKVSEHRPRGGKSSYSGCVQTGIAAWIHRCVLFWCGWILGVYRNTGRVGGFGGKPPIRNCRYAKPN